MKFLDHEKRRQLLNERHSCKMFDSHYEFSSKELEEIAEIARLSPSSYNTQPWHFVMVTNKDLKNQIAAHSYFNEEMIKSASALYGGMLFKTQRVVATRSLHAKPLSGVL
ncbi:hypothetical protein HpBHB33_12030 [Helicobacter pylori]